MNDITRELVQAVCDNNLQKAKNIVTTIIASDTAQKDKAFCNRMKNQLNNQSMNLLELPQNIKGLVIYEDVSVSFNENRYYLSEREHLVFDKILNMQTASNQLAEMGISFLNSTMLYGESGTGKTTFGRYIAYKMGVPFAYLNFSNIVSSYLGSTQKNISSVFDFIKGKDCVFMIDEVDVIGMRRGKEDVGEMSRVVVSLMQNLDMLANDVVLIGATNRIDMIDEALLRRFTNRHEVTRLNENERYEMVWKFLNDIEIKPLDNDGRQALHYCQKENTQAQITNDIVMSLAKSIQNGTEFKMLLDN